MSNALKWQGLPYFPISQLYRERFGEKVYKIPVSIAETCPNREGIRGMETCIFCDEWGSAARSETLKWNLERQISGIKEKIQTRYKAKKFLVYFQAYTTTFTQFRRLQESCEQALKDPDVLGIVIGTRPDCLSQALLNYWKELTERTALFIELGVQSFYNSHLEFLKRGHTREDSLKAIDKIHCRVPEANLGLHFMFGLPSETDSEVIEMARITSKLPINDVKLHNLHVLENTPLAQLYHQGQFTPVSLEKYAHRVSLFLQNLKPHIAVHRLSGVASRHSELIAPEWSNTKLEVYQYLIDFMSAQGTYQGRAHEIFSQNNLQPSENHPV